MTKTNRLTTGSGAPVSEDNLSRTVGANGPLAAENVHLFEKLAHFNRERIPERVVHARGSGAYGEFHLTRDLSEFSMADFLQGEGKQTDVFVRFSTVGGGQDSSDFARDPRGFAVKFYTSQGNWDLVGNNSLSPESLHQVTILMSDRGIPESYRHMNGYASHTLSLWNASGERTWVKWHFKTDQGVRCLTGEQAAGRSPAGAQQDLVSAIDTGDFPSWTVKIQLMSEEQARTLSFNPFDLTKVWPHADFPLTEIGKLILNRNVENYFAETEQSAFSPSHLVPGVGVSPDRMLQARLLAYPDAHRYRLGANYQDIPVNAARCPVQNYQRDGRFAGVGRTADGKVSFYPNDGSEAGAPAPSPEVSEPRLPTEQAAAAGWYDNRNEDNFTQAGNLYRSMSAEQKQQLCLNIAGGLVHATAGVQARMLAQFGEADPEYAAGVREALLSVGPARVT